MIKIDRHNLESIAHEYLCRIKTDKSRLSNDIIAYYMDNLEAIVLSLPQDFELINTEFAELYHLNRDQVMVFRTYMDNRYKGICAKHGYWLAKELKINICPYCNRQYTFTVDKQKKSRPQFDHFLSKSLYPHLALSFYNLIPCCPTCNYIKSNDAKPLLHPYFEGFDTNYRFSVNHFEFMLKKKATIEVSIDASTECIDENFKMKCKNNVDTFAIKELYQEHTDYIEEIVLKAYSYNQEYYNGLIEDFSKMGKSSAEIHRLIFGNYIERTSNDQRPLSKLTSDILEQIGLLY